MSDSPLVETIWRTQSERTGAFDSVAVSRWEMVVWRKDGRSQVTVRGPETKATTAGCPADAEFLGITFKLGTFIPHLPPSQLVDDTIPLPGAADGSFWLKGSAIQFPDFDHADVFVDRLTREGLLARDPLVDAVLRDEPHELSVRTVQRRFRRATGLTPRTIHQIERAREAASMLERGLSIADVIYQAGFADQPHLTRSLKRLLGQTPAKVLPREASR